MPTGHRPARAVGTLARRAMHLVLTLSSVLAGNRASAEAQEAPVPDGFVSAVGLPAILVPGIQPGDSATSGSAPVPPRWAPIEIPSPEDHRWEGAAIGFAIGAIALTFIGSRVCEQDCTGRAIGYVLVGGVLGGFPGFVIGGALEKRPQGEAEAPNPSSGP